MGTAVGEILPLAVGIAISPVPIIATILMLLSPQAKTTSLGFLVGWVAGITVAVAVFTALSAVLPAQDASDPSTISGVMRILLGGLLLAVAVRQWRSRPRTGEQPRLPKWMAALDSMTPVKSAGLAFLLAAVNPKNLLLAASAGLVVGGAGLGLQSTVIVVVVFVVLAASTVVVPVVGYRLAAARMAGPLDRLRAWLVDNNAAIMAVVLLVIGASLIGKGMGSL